MAARLDAYLSDLHRAWLAEDTTRSWREFDGSLLFFDITGFTPLTERLAKRGKAGVELLIDTLNDVVAPLVDTAAQLGGDTLKFAGDAVLVLFTGPGHAERAGAAAWDMQQALAPYRNRRTEAGRISLSASAGVASGRVQAFLAGDRFRELVLAGAVTTEVMALESAACAGEVLAGAGAVALTARPEVQPWVGRAGRVAAVDAAIGLPLALHDHLGPDADSEHRQVTVAFAQFRGVDEIVAASGPAAAAIAIDAIVGCAQAACERHGVTFLGTDADAGAGKLFLVAGAPTASTDDEDRMLHALREIVSTDGEHGLRVRAGVNRGRAFIVHLGSPQRRTYTTMGDATNLAARVMGKAPDGGVLATSAVLERVRAPYALEPVAPFAVKGKRALIEAQLVGEPRAVGGRAPAAATPLAGRTRELATLRDVVAAARAGEGRIVELVGEPGIGKSRLAAELAADAERAGTPRFLVEAGAYGTSTPYFALRTPLRRLVGAESDDEVAAALARIVREQLPDAEPLLPLLAIPFGIELPPTPQSARLSSDASATQLYFLVDRLLAALLARRTTLILIEDAHWLDEASSDLLRTVLRHVGERGWTALVTRRVGETGLTELPGQPLRIELEPLAPEAAGSLVDIGGGALAPHVRAALVERAGGNPLFLRELAAAAGAGAQLDELPGTVEALLTARIDTLAPADRRLLRRAAVLGARFPLAWLAGMLEMPAGALRESIGRLGHFLEHEAGSDRVRFAHALQREVAYETLPFGRRRVLHARAGELIERQLGAAAQSAADILGLHFLRAHDYERAWRYGRAAADQARDRFAPADAAVLYRRAIEAARALRTLPPAELADVWQALGESYSRAGEPAAAMDAFSQARRLVGHEDTVRQAQLMLCHARVAMDARHVSRAVRWLLRALRTLDGDDPLAAPGCRAEIMADLGSVRHRQGRSPEAIALCREAARIAEEHDARPALALALYTLDIALVESGRSAEAVHAPRALELYRELGDLDREGAVLTNLGVAAYFDGRWDDAVALYLQAADASARAGDLANAAIGDCNVGEIRADQGRLDEARARLESARDIFLGSGYDWSVGFVNLVLGRAAGRFGDHEEALELLGDALSRFRQLRTSQDVIWAEVTIAEVHAYAGHAEAALEEADRLVRDLGGGGRFAAPLQRTRGFALAQLSSSADAAVALDASLAAARRHDEPFELALAIDALLALGTDDRELRRELDELVARLDIVQLPAPALTPAVVAADGA